MRHHKTLPVYLHDGDARWPVMFTAAGSILELRRQRSRGGKLCSQALSSGIDVKPWALRDEVSAQVR